MNIPKCTSCEFSENSDWINNYDLQVFEDSNQTKNDNNNNISILFFVVIIIFTILIFKSK